MHWVCVHVLHKVLRVTTSTHNTGHARHGQGRAVGIVSRTLSTTANSASQSMYVQPAPNTSTRYAACAATALAVLWGRPLRLRGGRGQNEGRWSQLWMGKQCMSSHGHAVKGNAQIRSRRSGQKERGGRHVVAGAHAFCHRVLVAYDAEENNTSCISFGAACDRQYTTDATDGESDGEGILLQRTVCTRLSGSPEGLQRQKATPGSVSV